MSFLHPEFIYMMLPVLLLLFGMLTTQADLKSQIFSAEALEKLRVESDQFSSRTRNIFFLMMFVFIIMALAEPVVKQGEVLLDEKESSYYLLIDAGVAHPEEMQRTLQSVVKRYELSFGLVVLGSSDYLLSSATKDDGYLLERIVLLGTLFKQERRTPLELSAAIKSFLAEPGRKAIVITDALLTPDAKSVIQGYDVKVLASNDKEALEEFFKSREIVHTPKPLYFHIFIIPVALAMLMFIIATSSFYRGEKHFVPLILFSLLLSSSRAEASDFSFEKLQEAKKMYERGDYSGCAKSYYDYALEYESREATYNAANCYYRTAQYERSEALYRSIAFVEREKEFRRYFNLANTLVKEGAYEDLLEARKFYQKAKALFKTEAVDENLKAVNLKLSQWKPGSQTQKSVARKRVTVKAQSIEHDLNDEQTLNQRLIEMNNHHIYLLQE